MYRQEHPKPQFFRSQWENLNGEWQFQDDPGNSGTERGLQGDYPYSRVINVPFCPQSKLSGICETDFFHSVWYRRSFTLTGSDLKKHVILHFGAVDYTAVVYINGTECGFHKGGYVSFSFDISDFVKEGVNTVTVHAVDDERNPMIPSGKQSTVYGSAGCFYTRTTGIWQTVWLEFVPETHIKSFRCCPCVRTQSVSLTVVPNGAGILKAEAFYNGKSVGSASAASEGETLIFNISLSESHLWEVGHGRLYSLRLTYGDDIVESYFGLRSIDYRNKKFYLNGKPVFQRLVLDQGFFPDGIYTAPSDAELALDIERSQAMGFNGARLHEKVFEERFLYHCDQKGYLVWAEYPNWGLDHTNPEAIYAILPEWLEEIERDINHPSVIGWCPFNETWDLSGKKQYDPLLSAVYRATKAADPYRPCIDTSGCYHIQTDIFDVHNYEQSPEKFAAMYDKLDVDGTCIDTCGSRQQYGGKQPFFVSEYGGTNWSDSQEGWGYGQKPLNEAEFLARLKGLTDVLLDNPTIFAFCYTQLTDVEQEQNGLYTYDRKPKFDPALVRPIFSKKAACEE